MAVYAQCVIRAFIVAVRYAYMAPLRHKKYLSMRQPIKFLVDDFIAVTWARLTPDNTDRNIDASMFRLFIEP